MLVWFKSDEGLNIIKYFLINDLQTATKLSNIKYKKKCHRVEYFLSVCDAFLQYISFEDFAPIQFIAVFPCEQARPHKKYSLFTSTMSTQYELENVVRDNMIMKVILKSSFHLFSDFSPLTLPLLLSRRFPFAFTFLRVPLRVWRLKYIPKTTQAWGKIIQNIHNSSISN